MVLRRIASLLRLEPRSRQVISNSPTESVAVVERKLMRPKPTPEMPVYPPNDLGLQFYAASDVLATQADLVKRLRLATGVPPADYKLLYEAVIERLANTINLLPATETETHQGAGGLFRLCLEMGFYALQASEATIFAARAGVERRRLLEPRWRYASWLAGLCAELYRPVTTMIVTTADGDQWPTYRLTLEEWLTEKGADRYYVRWLEQSPGKPRPGRGAAASLAHKIISDPALQYLHEGSPEIVPAMLDVITGLSANQIHHPMGRIIEEVREKVTARDSAIRPQTYGKMTVGQHTEPHLLDSMRRLYKSGKWSLNIKKSRLWFGDEGLFLVWPTAANEMLDLLRDDGIVGIPKDSHTILDILAEAKIIEPHHEGGYFWTIYPPSAANELASLKLVDAKIVFGATFDEPESVGLLTKAPSKDEGEGGSTESVKSAPPPGSDAGKSLSAQEKDEGAPDEGAIASHGATPSTKTEPEITPRSASKASGSGSKPTHQPAAAAVSTPATNRKREPRPAGPAQEVDLGKKVKSELGKGLDDLTRDVFGALLDDLRSGKITNEAGKVKEGFAISLEQLAAYGIDITTFASEVQKAGWLYTHPEKPNKKIVEVQINGKLQRAIVIKLHVAVDMGFVT